MAFSVTRLLLGCCLAGAALAAPAQDTAGLVQNHISVHDPKDTVKLARGSTSTRMRKLLKNMVFSFASDGQRWSKLLFGNESVAAVPAPTAPSGMGVGCSDADRAAAMTSIETMQESMGEKMQEVMSKSLAQQMMGGGDGPLVPMSENSIPMDVRELIDLPESCASLLNQTSPDGQGLALNWPMLMMCAKDTLTVSGSCVQCFPSFGTALQAKCESSCKAPLGAVEGKLRQAMMGMRDEVRSVMEKTMSADGPLAGMGMANMPDEQTMLSVAKKASAAVNEILLEFVPCSECVAPEAVEFAGCVGGDEARAEVGDLAKQIVQMLKSGHFLDVEVVGPDQAQPADQGGMVQPL